MSKNDNKIKEFRAKILAKRKALGIKLPLSYTTSAYLTGIGDNPINLNTLQSEEDCVTLVRELLSIEYFTHKANDRLGTNVYAKVSGWPIVDWIADIKMRVSRLKWEREKTELARMDKQLADLLSADAKTSEAIETIGGML